MDARDNYGLHTRGNQLNRNNTGKHNRYRDGRGDIASVQINPTATTQVIPPNFMSIAQDLSEVTAFVGTESSNMNPIYEQLLKNMNQYANGPILIRELADESTVQHSTARTTCRRFLS